MNKNKTSIFGIFLTILLLASAAGCSSNPTKSNPQDPYESINRKVYSFNKAVDKAVLKPVTDAYVAVTPEPVQTGISNFLSNLGDLSNMINHLLQGKIVYAVHDASRFLANSTLGIGGLFDIASAAGMEKRNEDFGQTLGHWGVPAGPYIVMPFFGPSNVRDAVAFPVNSELSAMDKVAKGDELLGLQVLQAVNARKNLDKFTSLIIGDEYTFVRDAFTARRALQVLDQKGGRPGPPSNQVEDDFDTFENDEFDVFEDEFD